MMLNKQMLLQEDLSISRTQIHKILESVLQIIAKLFCNRITTDLDIV